MVVLREVEVICFGYGFVLLISGPLVLHSSGPSLLGLHRMAFTLCSFAHSLAFYVNFHKCPLVNGKSPKLMEFVSCEP
jgi:hypothetical protein